MKFRWRKTQKNSMTAQVGDYLLRMSCLPTVYPLALHEGDEFTFSVRRSVKRGSGHYDDVVGYGSASGLEEAKHAAEDELASLVSGHELLELLAEHGEEAGS